MRHTWSILALVCLAAWACQSDRGTPMQPAGADGPSATGPGIHAAHPAAAPFLAPRAPELARRPAPAGHVLVAAGGKAVVDDDGADCPDAGFTTIQDAVDAGAKDIDVCAGTYPENVVIGPDAHVKLEGAGTGATRLTGVAGTAGPILEIGGGSKVDVRDLTVDAESALAGDPVYGIRYTDSEGKVEHVEVLNVRNPSGGSQGVGIRVDGAPGARAKVKIKEVHVFNYTRAGIGANGEGAEMEVEKATVDGPVPPRLWAPNGVQFSRGASGSVKNSTIDNNPSPKPTGGGGSGIILLCAGDKVKVEHNTVTNADLGISLGDNAGADVHDNDVSGSNYAGISLQFIGNYYGGSQGCPGHPARTMGNRVHNNTIEGSGAVDDGIDLVNFDPATIPDTPNDNRIENNRVDGAAYGFAVYGDPYWGPAGNEFKNDRATSSPLVSCYDGTTGGGTAGTANEWKNDRGDAPAFPAGICE